MLTRNLVLKYRSVFEKQNYYEWIKYLEKANDEEDSYALANKLDASTERQNLNQYRNVLIEFNQTRCFYCGKVLKDESEKSAPVDHFIPWSFVKEDKLWNFVLACPTCNIKKSNKIAGMNYVKQIQLRNEELKCLKLDFVQNQFKTYKPTLISDMWKYAQSGGFVIM